MTDAKVVEVVEVATVVQQVKEQMKANVQQTLQQVTRMEDCERIAVFPSPRHEEFSATRRRRWQACGLMLVGISGICIFVFLWIFT